MTDYLGLVGLALVAFSMAALWISRMNSNAATPAAMADLDEHIEPARRPPSTTHLQFKLIPDVIVEEVTEAPARVEAPENGLKAREKDTSAPTPRAQLQPDSESASEQLRIAERLSLYGDSEGVREYAELVLDDKTASDRQRAHAEDLLRIASSF